MAALESVKLQQAFIAQRSVRLKGSVASRMGMSSKHRALNDAVTALDIPARAKALENIESSEAKGLKSAFTQQGGFFKKDQTSSYRLFKERFSNLNTTIGKTKTTPRKEASSTDHKDNSNKPTP